jgi:hypothetical protein
MVCILLSVSALGALVPGVSCLSTLPAELSADGYALLLVDDSPAISFAKGLDNIFAFAILFLRLKIAWSVSQGG